jgi:serine phosphatase RsbU (regulator of sigma subunit)
LRRRFDTPFLILAGLGGLALVLALVAIGDLAWPRPWDGVVLEADVPGTLLVREVVPGSGADRAGLLPGDRIVGIDRDVLRSPAHAAQVLSKRSIGEAVPYLVRRGGRLEEVPIELGRRYLAGATYLYACLLGLLFFAVGAFVLARQPRQRAAQVFFVVGTLFLLFLVCRLRPASYSRIDRFVLDTGTFALLFLPASFLHFFLIFPRPVGLRPATGAPRFRSRRRLWLATLAGIYALPPLVLAVRLLVDRARGESVRLVSGAPIDNWYVLALYMLVGLGVLAFGLARLEDPRERRGAGLVLLGSLLGLVPFLGAMVAFPTLLHTERFLGVGLVPLILVPVTFAVAIVRFGLLDIRVILRKSLAYSVLTAGVTLVYALAITLFNVLTRGSELAASPYFPFLFALAIAVLFEPLKRRSHSLVDRLLFAERRNLQDAIRELGEAMNAQVDPQAVVRDLVERLPRLLGLHFAALYLERDGRLARVAGPAHLPDALPSPGGFGRRRAGGRHLFRLVELRARPESAALVAELERLAADGVELAGELATPRRRIGLVLFSGSERPLVLDDEELALLSSLLGQAALALETGLLVEERTRQAELERELEIAAAVQTQLLPAELSLGAGWRVAAACRPARHVGGDFYTGLPGPHAGAAALVYGDVAGKSVSGALVMMAAHEALQTLALSDPEPARLFGLANQRLYRLGPKKSFVAAAWVAVSADGAGLDYVVAGQPQLLRRTADGTVVELPLPDHRLPLGALLNGGFEVRRAAIGPGDVVLGYSDGVLDAQGPDGEQFGDLRLAAVLAASPPEPERVIERVLDELRKFTAGTEPYDDITLVAIARDPEVLR